MITLHMVPVGLSIGGNSHRHSSSFAAALSEVLDVDCHPPNLPDPMPATASWLEGGGRNDESAELSSLLSSSPAMVDSNTDVVVLLASDQEGHLGWRCAAANGAALVARLNERIQNANPPWQLQVGLAQTVSMQRQVIICHVPGLDPKFPSGFDGALGVVCSLLAESHRRCDDEHPDAVDWRFHLSGGFKVFGQFMPPLVSAVGVLLGFGGRSDIYSSFDESPPIRVPLTPGRLDGLRAYVKNPEQATTAMRDFLLRPDGTPNGLCFALRELAQ